MCTLNYRKAACYCKRKGPLVTMPKAANSTILVVVGYDFFNSPATFLFYNIIFTLSNLGYFVYNSQLA